MNLQTNRQRALYSEKVRLPLEPSLHALLAKPLIPQLRQIGRNNLPGLSVCRVGGCS